MRWLVAALALAVLGACTPGKVTVESDGDKSVVAVAGVGGGEAGPYAMQVFAVEDAQIYLITGPDGKAAAARASGGQSASMAPAEAQTLLGKMAPAAAVTNPTGDKVSINLPFVSVDVQEGAANGDQAKVKIKAGGNTIEVDARGDQDLAHVRINGADEKAARNFIEEAEGLTPATKAEMRAAMGFETKP